MKVRKRTLQEPLQQQPSVHKRLSFLLIIASVCLAVFLSGCGNDRHTENAENGEPPITEDQSTNPSGDADDMENAPDSHKDQDNHLPDSPVEQDPIAEIIDKMSPAEKIGQLVMIGVEGESIDDSITAFIEEQHIGGIILYSRNLHNAEQSLELMNALKAANDAANEVPLFIGVDEEGGLVTRLPDEVLPTPASRDIGMKDSPDWTREIGQLIGKKVAAFGFNIDFAPVLDIDSNPDNPVIGSRSFGRDAETVIRHGLALMLGMKEQRVVPVIKHFPGHGDTSDDSHIDLPILAHDEERLRSFEMQPFIEAIEQGADAVMVAHLLVPAFDEHDPASLSRPIITDLLREELGFDGVVVTDDMTMGAIAQHYSFQDAVLRAVLAGSDIILIGHGYDRAEAAIQALERAYLSGELSDERLNESLRRILQLKHQYELSDEPLQAIDITELNELTEQVLSGTGT